MIYNLHNKLKCLSHLSHPHHAHLEQIVQLVLCAQIRANASLVAAVDIKRLKLKYQITVKVHNPINIINTFETMIVMYISLQAYHLIINIIIVNINNGETVFLVSMDNQIHHITILQPQRESFLILPTL